MLKFLIQTILLIVSILLLSFNIFTKYQFDNFTLLLIIIGLILITVVLNKYKRVDKRQNNIKILVIFCFTFMLQSILFLIGVKTGYSNNIGYIFKNYVSKTMILNIFLISFSKEFLRYLVVEIKTKQKYQYVVLQILMVFLSILIDLSIAPKRYLFLSFAMIYEFFALFLLPSISKNILLTYLSKGSGYMLTFVYIIIMDLNIYLLPTKTKLNMLVEAIILLVFPYLVYLYIRSLDIKSYEEKKKEKKQSKVVSFITTIAFAIMVCLVSREFKYSMIGIGSGSMTGTINKGDAIVYKTYDPKEDNIVGEVIVFQKENKMVVHRVLRQYVLNGKQVYQTKGDANTNPDNWIVKDDDIIGVVEFKILYIAWPSVLLGEMF